MRFLLIILSLLWVSTALLAQRPAGASGGKPPSSGKIFGKIVDTQGEAVAYASVQLWLQAPGLERKLLGGQLSQDNGDFSLDSVPVGPDLELVVSAIGFKEIKSPFVLSASKTQGRNPEKDMGNLELATSETLLKGVEVTAEASQVQLGLDRIIYRMDKNLTAQGGTAEDALRTIPSLSVDLDGNVALRNSAPQIFIDGRPTTLTPDQLPSDAIDRIEVITNPSAKFDTGGGQSGIVNIVLKKERRIGYNGQLRLGTDSYKGYTSGADINLREGKLNFFLSGNYNFRRTVSSGNTKRQEFSGLKTISDQRNEGDNSGLVQNYRGGMDWFLDNRNTLTLSGSYNAGQFNPLDSNISKVNFQIEDSLYFNNRYRFSDFNRRFRNAGASLLFKHIFPNEGHELTADINFNSIRSRGNGNYLTRFEPSNFLGQEKQEQLNISEFATFQTDYVRPLGNERKLETGLRFLIRDLSSDMAFYQFSLQTQDYVRQPNFADRYSYTDQVYAGYANYGQQFKKWGLQTGLRFESSQYVGRLPEIDTNYSISFPISIFPSLFLTRKINSSDNVQFSVSRRINRPSFFQLIPFTDFGDSLNITRGNPNLNPEFSQSVELAYFDQIKDGHSLLFSAYIKQNNDLMIRYLFEEFNPTLLQNVVVASYANAKVGYLYGGELTLRNMLFKIVEFTTNINAFQSSIDATNIDPTLKIEQFSWFVKENINITLPKQFTVQISGEYNSRTALVNNSGGGGRMGGGGGGQGWQQQPTSSAQGFTLPYWYMDLGLKKDFFNRKLSVNLNVQDVFATRIQGSKTTTPAFYQETYRLRNPQQIRINLTYKFGKQDASLFRRKNTRQSEGGMDGM